MTTMDGDNTRKLPAKNKNSTGRQTASDICMSMDHVSLTVRDVEKSIKFYSQALSMRLLRKSEVSPSPGLKYVNAFVYNDQFILELIPSEPSASEPLHPATFQSAMRGSLGITHLGVRVDDLEKAVEKMKAAGGSPIGQPITVDRVNTTFFAEDADPKMSYFKEPRGKPWRVALFSDPDGVTIELIER